MAKCSVLSRCLSYIICNIFHFTSHVLYQQLPHALMGRAFFDNVNYNCVINSRKSGMEELCGDAGRKID